VTASARPLESLRRREYLARELVITAHADAAKRLRHEGLTVPDAVSVLSELRRGTRDLVAAVDDVKEACEAIGLPLADADPPPRARLVRGWPLDL